jgi:hypothetical protein
MISLLLLSAAAATNPDMISPTPSCTGNSSGLNAVSCAAWQDLAKATNITGWRNCTGDLLDPCSCIDRVTCTDVDITRLSLADNNLEGTIPSSLASLTKLTWLYLAVNNLEGTIPSSLGSLPKMTSLYLSHNSLTGLVPPLLFKQYSGGCYLDNPGACTEPQCNHFKCPLPTKSEQCKIGSFAGVHCK